MRKFCGEKKGCRPLMLTLRVSGERDQLQAFMKHFSTQPYYKIMLDEHIGTATKEEEMTTQFEFLVTKQKPSFRKSVSVTLSTVEGKDIVIDLLDGQVVQVDDNVTCVFGKNFDIFA
jgi:hypothetical protein